MKGRGRKGLNKEEIAEDWCFKCKDGGTLLICDYKQCLKAYHCACVDKDDSFLSSGGSWTCNWHVCYLCPRASKYHCYCCPKAVCGRCIQDADFVHVRGEDGLCSHCLKLALLVAENRDVDSDGETVDLKNQETYEGLFREYFEIIEEKEGLNIEVLRAAKKRMKMGKNCPRDSDSEDYEDDEDNVSDYENNDASEGENQHHKKKGSKRKQSSHQRKVKSSKKQFVGWGSRSLIQFLSSIGKDTSEKLSQDAVTKIIDDYIREHKLVDPVKKRKIICDANLKSVMGRKIVNRNSIRNILESHFTENQDDSDENTLEFSSDEDGDALGVRKRQKASKDEGSPKEERASTVPQSKFASIVAENIKLVYLKRSLVYELCKQPAALEHKVAGSFVRVKCDPHDFYQQNPYQLKQVTGIKKASNGDENASVILLVSEIPKEICLSMLSNDDFTEAECDDLRSRVQAGVVTRPTVVELGEKARILHTDITKHWIARELELLRSRMDQANEKGRRREFFEYMERRRLLQTSTEQERLLGNIPRVIPDVLEIEPPSEDIGDEVKDQGGSPISALFSAPDGNGKSKQNSSVQEDVLLHKERQDSLSEDDAKIMTASLEEQPEQFYTPTPTVAAPTPTVAAKTDIIELSSDEEDDNASSFILDKPKLEDVDSSVWHITGTDEEKKETYSLSLLKKWSEICTYPAKVKVWKEGQSEDSAIWLTDAIKLAFP